MIYDNVETELELKIPLVSRGDDETVRYRVWFDFEVISGYSGKLHGNPDDRYEDVPDDYSITRIQIEISDGIWCDLNREHYHLYEDKLIELAQDHVNEMACV